MPPNRPLTNMKKILSLLILLTLSAPAWSQIVRYDTTGRAEKLANKKIDRGIRKTSFINKGQWFASGNIAYSSFTADDYKFLILDNLKAQTYSFGVKVSGGYVFAENLGAGIGFDYSRNMIDLPGVKIDLGDDMGLEIKDYSSIQQLYTGTAFLRTFISLGQSARFGLFSDIKLSVGGGQGKILNGQGQELRGTYQNLFKAGILVQPGVTVFLTDAFAVEASVGLLGLQYSRTEQVTNQVHQGYVEEWKANFKVNLFAINLGMSFYF